MINPGATQLQALITYANEVTGGSDTKISDAVATLASGYGGGSGGLTLIDTIDVSAQRGVQIDMQSTWFDSYQMIMIVPDLDVSALDWIYLVSDKTTGGSYTPKIESMAGILYSILVGKKVGETYYNAQWVKNGDYILAYPESYLYWYTYSASNTMTGTIKIYGIDI